MVDIEVHQPSAYSHRGEASSFPSRAERCIFVANGVFAGFESCCAFEATAMHTLLEIEKCFPKEAL